MVKWADYLVSKVKWQENLKTIDSFIIHEDNVTSFSNGIQKNRLWVIQKLKEGKTFYCIYLNESGTWNKGSKLELNINGNLKWKDNLPHIITKRKTFISYYHKDDQKYKESFKNLTDDLIVNKSVEDNDINAVASQEYIKQLIQKEYLNVTTVLVVLIGPKTKCRKHVDWEISGALNLKVGDHYSGLLGLILPNHPDFGKDSYTPSLIPERLNDNLETGYAVISDYTTDRRKLQILIEKAFKQRKSKEEFKVNSRKQKQLNTCS